MPTRDFHGWLGLVGASAFLFWLAASGYAWFSVDISGFQRAGTFGILAAAFMFGTLVVRQERIRAEAEQQYAQTLLNDLRLELHQLVQELHRLILEVLKQMFSIQISMLLNEKSSEQEITAFQSAFDNATSKLDEIKENNLGIASGLHESKNRLTTVNSLLKTRDFEIAWREYLLIGVSTLQAGFGDLFMKAVLGDAVAH